MARVTRVLRAHDLQASQRLLRVSPPGYYSNNRITKGWPPDGPSGMEYGCALLRENLLNVLSGAIVDSPKWQPDRNHLTTVKRFRVVHRDRTNQNIRKLCE